MLVPLFSTRWWQSPTQSLKAAVDEIFKENPYLPDENLTAILVVMYLFSNKI